MGRDFGPFVILFGFHLGFTLFPFPVSTAKFIGEFGSNNGSSTNVEAPVVLEATPNFIGAALLPVPWAKQGAFAAPLTNFRGFFFIRRTSPISRK
jgi:hypothetical protein